MSQTHTPSAGVDSSGLWLPLIEYSVRSGLSLSTIRRKIKSNSLQYRMENGRYLIRFDEQAHVSAGAPTPAVASLSHDKWDEEPATGDPTSAMESAVRMVSEAFEHALREKDERIRLLEKCNRALEERLNELRLLVKVLEEKYEVRY